MRRAHRSAAPPAKMGTLPSVLGETLDSLSLCPPDELELVAQNAWAPVHESIAGPFFILVMRNVWYTPVLTSRPHKHLAFALAASRLGSNCRRHNLRLAAAHHLGLRRDLVSLGDEVNGSDPVASFSSSSVD